MSTLLNAALEYAANGWHVFPLKEADKRPATARGFQDATTDPDQIRTWWGRNPRYNIGIATGADSGFVVLDTDNPDAEEYATMQGDTPTRCQTTAKGRHRLYKHPGTDTRNTTALHGVAGLDVRGDGGYIVAAPSVHPTGAVYAWENDNDLAPLPEWITRKPEPEHTSVGNGTGASADRYAQAALNNELAALARCQNGTRNDTLFRVCRRVNEFVLAGRLPESVFTEIETVAQRTGLPEKEITATIASARAGGTPEDAGLPEDNQRRATRRNGSAPEQARGDQADEEPRRSRFNLETLDDLAQLPPTEWLIPERIPADSLTLLYGPSESGKSFIALHWALTIALRNPDRAVIYVAPEGGSGYQKRAAAWLQHWKKAAPRNLLFIRSAPRLGDASDLRELIDTITPYQPLFVALDTLARCAVELDENSAKDMGLFIEACDKIRRATGAAVMPVHHSGKDARNGARGSSALRAAVDMAHEVQRDGELVTLACDKSKDIAKPDSIYLHMMEVAESVVLMPSDKVITTRDSKLQKNERAALEALALEVFENAGASARKLVEISGVPEGSLYRVLSKLLKRGYITQASKGDPYYISDTGRRAITNYQESINSGASWGPDDGPPEGGGGGGGGGGGFPPRNLMQEAMKAGDSGDSSGDSFNCELSPEYGSTKPNYHTITGYDGAEVIETAPESGELSPDYHQDTAPESPTITSITDYHPTIDSDTSSLSSPRGYICDTREVESAAAMEGDTSIATQAAQVSGAAAPAEPAHDAALVAACGPMAADTRRKIANVRQNWRGSEAAFSQLCRVLGWDVADAARAWTEAEKLTRAQAREREGGAA
jgi:hypothetical protein